MTTVTRVLRWIGLSLLWLLQYGIYVPLVAVPLRLLRAGSRLTLTILLVSVIGWPVLILWVVVSRRPRRKRRPLLQPWLTRRR